MPDSHLVRKLGPYKDHRYASAYSNETSPQTNKELVAAPGAEQSIYVVDVIISNELTAGTVFFVQDTTGTPQQLEGNIYLNVYGGYPGNGASVPMKVAKGKNLGFTSAGFGKHSVTVRYYIE